MLSSDANCGRFRFCLHQKDRSCNDVGEHQRIEMLFVLQHSGLSGMKVQGADTGSTYAEWKPEHRPNTRLHRRRTERRPAQDVGIIEIGLEDRHSVHMGVDAWTLPEREL